MIYVSVVIPTYNRANSLGLVLDMLARQTMAQTEFEVIVVDDGSEDHTSEVVERSEMLNLRYERQANQGEIVARDRGVARATGEILTFLDNDIYVSPLYLEALLDAFGDGERRIVIGNIYQRYLGPADELCISSLYLEALLGILGSDERRIEIGNTYQQYLDLDTDTLAALRSQISESGERTPEFVLFVELCGHSFLLAKSDYAEIGGMNPLDGEGRNAWGGIDFAYRAHRLGYSIYRAPAAIGIHNDLSLKNFNILASRWERVCARAVLLLQRHPALQGQVPMLRDKEEINWKEDEWKLIGRKTIKRMMSLFPLLELVDLIVTITPKRWRAQVETWGLEPHMVRGFRRGLQQHGSLLPVREK